MVQSSALLDLAVEAIEYWSYTQESQYGATRISYRYGFLGETSYENVHSQRDIHHVDSMNILFDAVEAGILYNAKYTQTGGKNCERLCFHHEGALLYFGILACTQSPEANIDLIGRMLCDRSMLEFELSFELGGLIQSIFTFLPSPNKML